MRVSLSFELRAQNLVSVYCTICVPHPLSGMGELGLEELSGSVALC